MKTEPSVLDYVKARLAPWRSSPPALVGGLAETARPLAVEEGLPEAPQGQAGEAAAVSESASAQLTPIPSRAAAEALPASQAAVRLWPWRSLLALGLALAAQRALEPGPERAWEMGLFTYLLAAACLAWAFWRGEMAAADPPAAERRFDPLTVRQAPFYAGVVFSWLAFLSFGGNRFTAWNVLLWTLGLALLLYAFWVREVPAAPWFKRLRAFLARPAWSFQASRWSLALLAAAALVIFFRVYRLEQVPPEMVSDHAEKLLDVWDVLNGEARIFFPRNTGREGLQMYLTAAVIRLFGTGYSFLSLKIGMLLAGLLTLPYLYLLGKELGNRRVGLLAVILAGIAYWPNVISRVALRFSLYPLFVAPVLYYLARGLRRSSRNDFLLAGLALGFSLHGYTPARILPLVVLAGVAVYLLHRASSGARAATLEKLALLALVALIVFLPLLRFWIENPDLFAYRAYSRLLSLERPLPEPAGTVFLRNLWNALAMFAWNNGEIWPISIPYRPALDVVSAALFHLGIALLAVRYLLRRHWLDLFLLLSIPLLMMPSILSLAFPSENPALNRTAGALVPVFLVAGFALDALLRTVEARLGEKRGAPLAWAIGLGLLALSAFQNYDLVFRQYQRSYERSSWNTNEVGSAIRAFADSLGEAENAYVVAYPYWVDTRLVGINAGFPTRDFAINPEQFDATLAEPGPKLFILFPEDQSSLAALQLLYPDGFARRYLSRLENKDFWLFYVLPEP